MVLSHTDGQGGRDQYPHLLAHPARYGFGADSVGTEQAGWAVLLGGPDGDQDTGRMLQIRFDLLPSAQRELHSWSSRRLDAPRASRQAPRPSEG